LKCRQVYNVLHSIDRRETVIFDEQTLRYFTEKGLLEHITDEDFMRLRKETEEIKDLREDLRYHLTLQESYEQIITQKRKELKKRNALWRRWMFSSDAREKMKKGLAKLVQDAEKENETVKTKRDAVDVLEQVALALQRYVSIPTGYVKLTEEGKKAYLLLDGFPEDKSFEDFLRERAQKDFTFSRSTS